MQPTGPARTLNVSTAKATGQRTISKQKGAVMKCPVCIREGLRSKVIQGALSSTAVYYPVTYDEDGALISSGHNRLTVQYTCTNGHSFTNVS